MSEESPFADLADEPLDAQVARLEGVAAAQKSGKALLDVHIRELTRELPRMKDPRPWFLGWSILQGAEVSSHALRLAEFLVSEPSEPGNLRRDPAFRYLYDKDPSRRDLIVAKGLESRDPGVLIAAAAKVAPTDRMAAIRGVLDAYTCAAAWNAHDVFESVSAWIEQLASPELASAIEERLRRTDDEDEREQLAEWLDDTRARLERRA